MEWEAIDISRSSEISSCTFTGNTAKYGGALSISGGSYKITNSIFSSNPASVLEGVIYSIESTLTLTSVTFTSNKVNSGSGGAVNAPTSSISVSGSNFNNNLANSSSGGGIYASSSTATIVSTTFTTNNATIYGGAIYSNARLTINISTFNSNKATNNGRAIYGASSTN